MALYRNKSKKSEVRSNMSENYNEQNKSYNYGDEQSKSSNKNQNKSENKNQNKSENRNQNKTENKSQTEAKKQ
jgi:hypothetical protein